MKNLFATIRFITVLPVGTLETQTFDAVGMLFWFPIVGLMIGGMLAGIDMAACWFWSTPVASLLDVVFLAAVTGALHIDGLGDTADGLYGNRTKERALAIMKDSRIGAMGVIAIGFGLAVKWGGISGITDHRHLWLLIIPAYARASMIFGIRWLPYGRPGGGTGSSFFERPPQNTVFVSLLIPVGMSLMAGWRGFILMNLAFILLVSGMLGYYKRKIGCITGDMLGALNEITESAMFLVVSARGLS